MKSGDTPTYVKLSSTSEEHCAPVTALQVVKDVGEDYEADEKGEGIGCTAVYVAIGCDLALRHAERRHQTACHALWPFFGLSFLFSFVCGLLHDSFVCELRCTCIRWGGYL